MSDSRILVLGGGVGWHSNQLIAAAHASGCHIAFAPYETLASNQSADGPSRLTADAAADNQGDAAKVDLKDFDAVLTRTMPPGSLEQITFRLACLHAAVARGDRVVNRPRGLEIAIDKFAALEHIARLGYDVPETIVVQSRAEAMEAFGQLGGDCIVKPLFGGEGRGVMRIRDAELAWYTFTTLEQLGAVFYVQRFISPGGRDTRLLVIGEHTITLRRESENDFRTNVSGGAQCRVIENDEQQDKLARRITSSMELQFASVDIIDSDDGRPRVLEVNAVPGWRGAQRATSQNIASLIIGLLKNPSR
ncbi:ATP-grasp domain-containing protein [Planctomycetes bacterium K23_9]|uniref:Ribosomal protein S6 modification protein n=1 Tax=Stieleria marina TaxID=1930275 RepID=A0A517NVC8_9BACT|nr:Ribosomal protein S6 modification protein [Planctomycetes bacterium K23_9]